MVLAGISRGRLRLFWTNLKNEQKSGKFSPLCTSYPCELTGFNPLIASIAYHFPVLIYTTSTNAGFPGLEDQSHKNENSHHKPIYSRNVDISFRLV
jgi:hypothetical protein